jgi:hypothetical protein
VSIFCDASHTDSARATFKLISCSDYSHRSVPSYWKVMRQAWILQPASAKRAAGFVRATDLRDEEYARHISDWENRTTARRGGHGIDRK